MLGVATPKVAKSRGDSQDGGSGNLHPNDYNWSNRLGGSMMRKLSWILLLLIALVVWAGCDAFMMRDDAAGHFLVKVRESVGK